MCAGGLVVKLVKLVKARSSERHASSAQVGDLVIEVAAMLEVRACAVHTRLSLAPSVRHLCRLRAGRSAGLSKLSAHGVAWAA